MSRGALSVRVVALLLLGAATGWALHRLVILPMRCARTASLGANALDAGANLSPFAQQFLATRVRESLAGCACVTAREAHIAFIAGGVSSKLGDYTSAIAEYQRALATERRPEIYFGLGMAQLNAMQRAAGVESLTRACTFDPSRLADVPYQDVRDEIERRMRATYGPGWVP